MPSPKEKTRAEEYALHLAEVRRSTWRLGRVGGHWQVARLGPDTDGWVVLDEQLAAVDGTDPMVERRRVSEWLRDEVLGVHSVVRHRDYAADAQGREAYDLEVMS